MAPAWGWHQQHLPAKASLEASRSLQHPELRSQTHPVRGLGWGGQVQVHLHGVTTGDGEGREVSQSPQRERSCGAQQQSWTAGRRGRCCPSLGHLRRVLLQLGKLPGSSILERKSCWGGGLREELPLAPPGTRGAELDPSRGH